MILTTDELVERFNRWATQLSISLRVPAYRPDSEIRSSLAQRKTIGWCIENLKRIRDEIDAEYASKS